MKTATVTPIPEATPSSKPSRVFFRLLAVAGAVAVAGLLLARPAADRGLASIEGGADPPPASSPVAEVSVARDERITALAAPSMVPYGPAPPPILLVPRALAALDVRIGPAEGYIILGLVPRGGALEIVGKDATGEWVAIVFSPGSKLNGWVPRKSVGNLPDINTLPIARVTLLP